MLRHARAQRCSPTTTLIFLNLGFVVSGPSHRDGLLPGPELGPAQLRGAADPDYPLLQGVFLLFSAAVIIANLLADLLYAYLDPRVRTG